MRAGLAISLALLAAAAGAVTDPAVRLEAIVKGFVTPVPGGLPGETFRILGSPAMHHGNLAFEAWGTLGTQGVFCYCDGSLVAVASKDEPVPGLPDGVSGEFAFISSPVIFGQEVVMVGGVNVDGGTDFFGLYQWDYPGLAVVLDPWTELPLGQPVGVTHILHPSLDDAGLTFVFFDDTASHRAIYRYADGNFEALVSQNTPLPGEPPTHFVNFGQAHADGFDFSFVGRGDAGGGSGVYKTIGAELSLVADHATEAPGGEPGEVFQHLVSSQPVIGNGTVLFFASTSTPGEGGFYREKDGELQEVVTTRTINPLTGTLFNPSFFDNTKSADGDSYAVQAGTDSSTLFFGDAEDRLYAIATEGEELEGQTLQFIFMGKHAISGNQLAFNAFRASDEVIYIATIGENPLEIPVLHPVGRIVLLVLLASAGLLVLRRVG